MNTKKIIIGIILWVLSYAYFFIPTKHLTFNVICFLFLIFMVGIILICESVTCYLRNVSLIKEIIKSKHSLINFIFISFIGGILIELLAKWLGKLWVYPYFDFFKYAITFIPLFAFYWLTIIEIYLTTKFIFDYFYKGRKIIRKSFLFEKKLFNFLGVLGVVLIILCFLFIIDNIFRKNTVLFNKSDLNFVTSNYQVSFILLIGFFIGLWFIFEMLEYNKRKTSLLKDIFHHYLPPIFSILIGSFILAILMETQNLPSGFWTYVNWPYQNIKFLSLPIFMFLAWPLHYIVFLSMFRTFTGKESGEVWRGDLIK